MHSQITPKIRIAIVTHELFYGASRALLDYLIGKKVDTLLFLSHPILAENPESIIQCYTDGKLIKNRKNHSKFSGSLVGFLFDFLDNIVQIYSEHGKIDLYIGINPLNCILGILLKKVGKVKRVIFYSIDFSPIRFSNSLLNNIYHAIESLCVRYSDERWNVSSRIAEGRKSFLKISSKMFPQKVVPIGIWKHEIIKRNQISRSGHTIVFVGHLLEKQGVQMVINAMPIIKIDVPSVRFIIIGGGEYEDELKELTKQLGLDNSIEFTDWIHDPARVRKILSKCDVAVATYSPLGKRSNNFSYYADPTKIKTYLSCQLPVVMTNVSYNATELSRRGCVILVDYNEKSIAYALVSLFQDENKLKQMRKNALDTIATYTWNKIFDRAFYEK